MNFTKLISHDTHAEMSEFREAIVNFNCYKGRKKIRRPDFFHKSPHSRQESPVLDYSKTL